MRALPIILLILASELVIMCSIIFEPVIPHEVEGYVDEYISEGAKRGVTINKDRIKVVWKPLEDKHGRGIHGVRHKLILDPDDWKGYNDWKRRWLVFHECGHAIFNQGHRYYKVNYIYEHPLAYGPIGYWRWSSIMAAGKMNHTVDNGYFEKHYSEYMDEMFNYGDWKYK